MKVEVLKRYKDKETGKTLEAGVKFDIADKSRRDELEAKGFIKVLEVKKTIKKSKKASKDEIKE